MSQAAEPVYATLLRYTKALSVALGLRDSLTRMHSERVLGLSEAIGIAYSLSERELTILKFAAAFHDIGKIGIPDQILKKPSALNDDEWDTMKRHSCMGEEIITATELPEAPQVARIIRHHHEHFDGHGYPDGLATDKIPLCSRIISIADSYDAMAMTRQYHPAKTHREIMTVLHRETEEKHHPEVMEVFCRIIESSQYKTSAN